MGKVCPTCHREGEFFRNRSTKDGLSTQCKKCHTKSAAASLAKFRREKAKSPERRAARRARYAERTGYIPKPPLTKEEVNAKKRGHYQQNKEYYRKKNSQWIQSHPIENRFRAAKRRMRKANVLGGFDADQWQAIKVYFGDRCLRCGRVCQDLQPDHVKPISRGGPNQWHNIQPLCKSCNSSKKDKDTDFRTQEEIDGLAEMFEYVYRPTGLSALT